MRRTPQALMREVSEANEDQIARKRAEAERERDEEMRVAEYIRQRDAREQVRFSRVLFEAWKCHFCWFVVCLQWMCHPVFCRIAFSPGTDVRCVCLLCPAACQHPTLCQSAILTHHTRALGPRQTPPEHPVTPTPRPSRR